MTNDRPKWTEVGRLFRGALDLDPEERAVWLAAECDDPSLRAEAERLLRTHDGLGDFLTTLDGEAAAALVDGVARSDPDPERVGPYRIVRRLARGGMGVVYLARDERLDRPVALKCLSPWLDTDSGSRERFLAEARAASRLDHPHIATVHDVGETPDGGLYIAMSYYEGETLAERIGRGPMDVGEARDLATQIADALEAAHAAGIVHRDIKPANLMVTPNERVKVLDFGIAKTEGGRTTRAGVRLGTVAYMSPEQTRGEAIDTRTDVWSFGAVLYEMLTGRRPFLGPEDVVIVHAIRHDAPRPIGTKRPGLPTDLTRLVERCLAKDPARRPADGGALVDALTGPGAGGTGNGQPGNMFSRIEPGRRLRFAALLVAGFAVLAVLTLAGDRLFRGSADRTESTSPDPRLVMVLPFTPIGDDTALVRQGRNLAITLGTALDGLGDLRTIDGSTVAARSHLWHPGDGVSGAADDARRGLELARELGAGRVLHGTLLRAAGGTVRTDLSLYRTSALSADAFTGAFPRLRATATAPLADVGALTDSVTHALLPHLWPSERTPEIEPHALSRTPLPALRAFLEGELATADGRWRKAPDAFARAIALDSTFWLAYARYVEALSYWGRPVEPEIRATLFEHLPDLPPHEQALIESRRADSLSERLAKARTVTERFPTSWRAWFGLAEQLIHNTMFLGTTLAEAREAIERTATLNPNRGTHWQHLMWLATIEGDTTATDRALRQLDRLEYDSATLREGGLDQLAYYRYLHLLLVAGDSVDATESRILRASADSLARQLVGYSGPIDLETLGGGVSVYAPHIGDILLAEATLTQPVPDPARAGMLRGLAQAWAGRGAWDSATAVLVRYVSEVDGIEPVRHALRVAVIGEWLGVLPPEASSSWRAALLSGDQGNDRAGTSLGAAGRAEVAWLDGMAGFARGDTAALAAARRWLGRIADGLADGPAGLRRVDQVSSLEADSLVASLLARSLAAHRIALDGRPEAAADSLLELERQRAEHYWFRRFGNLHPYLTAVNRLDAARWLLNAGRPGDAARLLRWHETVQFPAHLAHRADASLRGVIHYHRGRAAADLGRADRAREHFRRAIDEFDRPVEELRPLLDSARVALR